MMKKPMESKKTAAAEVASMKRGGASKSLLAAERAEHKGMGYKAGGMMGMKSKAGISSGGDVGGYDGKSKQAKKR